MGSTLLPFRCRFLEGVMGKFRSGRQGRLDLNKFPSNSKTRQCCHLRELGDCSEHQFCGLTANYLPAFVSAAFPYSGVSHPFTAFFLKGGKAWTGEGAWSFRGNKTSVCFFLWSGLQIAEWGSVGQKRLEIVEPCQPRSWVWTWY